MRYVTIVPESACEQEGFDFSATRICQTCFDEDSLAEYAEVTPTCDICELPEWCETEGCPVCSNNWNGETGCHVSCEGRRRGYDLMKIELNEDQLDELEQLLICTLYPDSYTETPLSDDGERWRRTQLFHILSLIYTPTKVMSSTEKEEGNCLKQNVYKCNAEWYSVLHPPGQFRHWCSALEAGYDCMHFEDYDD